MEKLRLDSGDGASPADAKQANSEEAKNLAIQNCLQSLVHACHCKDARCKLQDCQKMKLDVAHYKLYVERKRNVNSPECQQLIALCCHHAKQCHETKCLVPLCFENNRKLKEQQRNQHDQLVGEMAMMDISANDPAVTSKYGQTSNSAVPVNAEIKPGLSPTNLPSHQPAISSKPLTQAPPADVTQAMKELIQEEAARQKISYPGHLKFSTSNGITVTGEPYRMIRIDRSHSMPMEHWNTPRYPMNPVSGQINPGLRHQDPLIKSQTQWQHSIPPHMRIYYGETTPSSGIGGAGQPGVVMQSPPIPRAMTGFTAPQLLSTPGWTTARLYPVMQTNPGVGQQGLQMMTQSQPQQQPQVPRHIAIGGQTPREPIVIPVPAMPGHGRQQLIARVWSPSSPEQQDDILEILKSNLAGSMKRRQQEIRKLLSTGRPLGPTVRATCPAQSQEQQPGWQQSMNKQQLIRYMLQKMGIEQQRQQRQQPGQYRRIQPQWSGGIVMSKL